MATRTRPAYNAQRPVTPLPQRPPRAVRALNLSGLVSVFDKLRQRRGVISAAQLAEDLDVSDDVVYRMVREGGLVPLMLPGVKKTLFDPAAVAFWLRKHNPIYAEMERAS